MEEFRLAGLESYAQFWTNYCGQRDVLVWFSQNAPLSQFCETEVLDRHIQYARTSLLYPWVLMRQLSPSNNTPFSLKEQKLLTGYMAAWNKNYISQIPLQLRIGRWLRVLDNGMGAKPGVRLPDGKQRLLTPFPPLRAVWKPMGR